MTYFAFEDQASPRKVPDGSAKRQNLSYVPLNLSYNIIPQPSTYIRCPRLHFFFFKIYVLKTDEPHQYYDFAIVSETP